MLWKTLALVLSASFLTGCAMFNNGGGFESATQPRASYSYPIDDTLEVKVEFESMRAVNACQLGLSMLSKARDLETPIRVENSEFFPEYFAMVNVNIEDGLLYVSNLEAENFARIIFLEYQKKVAPSECLRKMRKRRVIDGASTVEKVEK